MSNTPTLGELFGRAISTALNGVNTALPARVVSFYPEERKVDVQPLIRKQMADGTVIDYPTILSVPICYPSSSNSLFYFPLAKGDPVLLVFSQSSTDNWLFSTSMEPVDPEDSSRFNISDAFVVPGVFPFPLSTTIWNSQTLTKDPSSVIIKHNIGTASEAEIVIGATGTVSMKSPTTVEITAPTLNVTGNITATGSIAATGVVSSTTDVTAGATSLKLHIHSAGTLTPTTPPGFTGLVTV